MSSMSASSLNEVKKAISLFEEGLRRREVSNTHDVALQTALLFRTLTSHLRFTSASHLISQFHSIGTQLSHAHKTAFTCTNIVKRIIRILRDEAASFNFVDQDQSDACDPISPTGSSSRSCMLQLFRSQNPRIDSTSQKSVDLRPIIISGIQELIDEIEKSSTDICAQALDYIQTDDVILTYGAHKILESFIKVAARKRRITLLILDQSTETSKTNKSINWTPSDEVQTMAQNLGTEGVNVMVLPDSAAFSVMSRCQKVILSAHTILTNGGCLSPAGTRAICQSAKFYSNPVIFTGALYNLSTTHPYEPDTLVDLKSPECHYPFSDGDVIDRINFMSPSFDYISPDLIDLYITNQGGQMPSYMYRLASDLYDDQEWLS